jgi:hypothetical protein
MTALRIACVFSTAAGGTGQHAALLAEGCAARGLAVTAFGPADTWHRFFRGDPGASAGPSGPGPGSGAAAGRHMPAAGRELPGVGFEAVEIADRPRPASDAAAIRRLRGLLAQAAPDVVHAHGMRAGAIAAIALTRPAGPAPALAVTVHNAKTGGVMSILF